MEMRTRAGAWRPVRAPKTIIYPHGADPGTQSWRDTGAGKAAAATSGDARLRAGSADAT